MKATEINMQIIPISRIDLVNFIMILGRELSVILSVCTSSSIDGGRGAFKFVFIE
jgi:hypothetical protein